MNKKLKKFKDRLCQFGYIIPKNAEFYQTRHKKKNNRMGMKVGGYVHSCHIDTIDIFVLLFIDNNGETSVEDIYDLWLQKIE